MDHYKPHLRKKHSNEDILMALQLPIALIALAVLFFLH